MESAGFIPRPDKQFHRKIRNVEVNLRLWDDEFSTELDPLRTKFACDPFTPSLLFRIHTGDPRSEQWALLFDILVEGDSRVAGLYQPIVSVAAVLETIYNYLKRFQHRIITDYILWDTCGRPQSVVYCPLCQLMDLRQRGDSAQNPNPELDLGSGSGPVRLSRGSEPDRGNTALTTHMDSDQWVCVAIDIAGKMGEGSRELFIVKDGLQ
ncbi:hypothetical protein FB451DRAFT_1187596 [Mycena latifolia]|nr:hypothetical protein FB451DRAFT_1187596 [Mycena latifolia]